MLKIQHVTLSFGQKKIFNDLSLNFEEGTITGLVAPNGTGKSTLINIILNNLTPQVGFVEYDGLRYKNERDIVRLHKKICAFPDQSDLFSFMTGRDHLKLYANLWHNNPQKVKDIISTLKMETYIDRKVETYSLGMKQRLCFAMVVATNTSVMLLDEVMNGLDPQNVQLISQVLLNLRAQGKLIIMASHLLQNLQQYADQVLFLKNGRIIKNLNNKAETKKYLEFNNSSLINDILEESNYQILPNQTILLPIDELNPDKFDSIIHILLENNVSFTVRKISLEDLFNKFYG